MNLWIVLAITWISVSVVIADSSWFVQDTPLVGDDTDSQLFHSEHLIRVDKKKKTPPAIPTPVKKDPPRPPAQSRTVGRRDRDKSREEKDVSHVSGVREEELLLVVSPTGRKPLQTGKPGTEPKSLEVTADKTTRGGSAATEWFVQDDPEESEGRDGLFPSENLIRIYNEKTKKWPAVQTRGVIERTAKAKAVNNEKKTNKPQKKNVLDGVETEGYLPPRKEGKSERGMENGSLKPGRDISHDQPVLPLEKPHPNIPQASRNVDSWFAFTTPATVDSGRDDLSEEYYILVSNRNKNPKTTEEKIKNKSPTQDKKTGEEETRGASRLDKKSVKPSPDVVSLEGHSEGEATLRKTLQLAQGQGVEQEGVEEQDPPCDPEKDVDCLMADENLILVRKSNPKRLQPSEFKPLIKEPVHKKVLRESKVEHEPVKEREVRRESLHRRLLENNQGEKRRERRAAIILDESEELALEEKEEKEEEDLLWSDDTPLRRFARQATEESGDGGFDGETEIQSSTYTLTLRTIMNTTLDSLTAEDVANITLEFVRQLEAAYQNTPLIRDIIVNNVTLDQNGRVVIDWDLELLTSAAPGNTQQERAQSSLAIINNTVIPFINDELRVRGEPVYEELDTTVTLGIAGNLLSDACLAQNSCPDGYICISAESICRHLCYHNSFNEQCRHGSTCQLDDSYQPYCQCGSGYTGEFCETAASESQYSTEQVVGAGAAGAVAAVGVVGAVAYFALSRRTNEEDMEYSYFGDNDAPMPAYSDPDSNLGVNAFSIARPTLVGQADLFHDAAVA